MSLTTQSFTYALNNIEKATKYIQNQANTITSLKLSKRNLFPLASMTCQMIIQTCNAISTRPFLLDILKMVATNKNN